MPMRIELNPLVRRIQLAGPAVRHLFYSIAAGLERVARLDPAVFHTAAQPRHALSGATMSARLRRVARLRLALQQLVADCRGGAQGLFSVAGIEQILVTAGVM